MSIFALFLFVLLASALPGVWPRALGLASYAPDLWVALVVYLALRGRGYLAVGWGIALGLLRDALSLDPLGTHAFVLGVTAFVFCEGQLLRIQDYQSLFALLGTNYGGDGRTTLGLPDTRRLERDLAKRGGLQSPPFRYAIALGGTFPSRA